MRSRVWGPEMAGDGPSRRNSWRGGEQGERGKLTGLKGGQSWEGLEWGEQDKGPSEMYEVRGQGLRAWCISGVHAPGRSLCCLPPAPFAHGLCGQRCSGQGLGVTPRMQEVKGAFAFLIFIVSLSRCPQGNAAMFPSFL